MLRFAGITLVLALACGAQPVGAQPAGNSNDARTSLAMEILAVTDAKSRMMQAVGILEPNIFKLISDAHPELSQKAVDVLRTAVHEEMQASMDDLLRQEAQVYVQHFSESEMRALLAFYKTEVGTKLLAEMPAIMKESAVLGEAWGRRAGIRAAQGALARLKSKGYKI